MNLPFWEGTGGGGAGTVRITVESFWPQFGLILHVLPGFSVSTAILPHVREVCFATQFERKGRCPGQRDVNAYPLFLSGRAKHLEYTW